MLKRRKYRQSIARSSRAFVAFLCEAAVVGASALGILPLYAYQFDPFASPPSRVKLQLSRVTLQSSLDHAAEGTPNADFAEETTIPIKDWVTELLRGRLRKRITEYANGVQALETAKFDEAIS
jgi:hypothetical protein